MSDWVPAVKFRTYRPSDREWISAVNVRHYRDVEGFDAQFEGLLTESLDLLDRQRHDKGRHFLVGVVEGHPIGCIFLSVETPEIGRTRLFYLDEIYRGTGIASEMLESVIEAASTVGFQSSVHAR